MRRAGWNAMLSMVMAIAVLAVPPPQKADAAVPVSVLPDVKHTCFASGDPPSVAIHEMTSIATAYLNIGKTNSIGATGAIVVLEPSAPALHGRSQYSAEALPARYTKYGGATRNTEINTAFALASTNTGTRAAEPAYAMTVLERTARMNE